MRTPYLETLHRVLPDAGEPAVVRQVQSSSRSQVWLVEFGGSPTVVKRLTGTGDGFEREVTALRQAGLVRPRPVAELLAADPSERLLVLEYLSGPPSRNWAVDYATALARLHTADGGGLPAWTGPATADIEAFLDLADRCGVAVPGDAVRELHTAVARPPGAGALLHGDPCPDNAIATEAGVRFVDLEQAHHGPGAVELAYLRIGFPTCWCAAALPPTRIAEAEAAYLSIRPAGDLAAACAGWLIRGDSLIDRARRDGTAHLTRLTGEDWPWGTATARQRFLHRLDVTASFGAELPAVAALASAFAASVRRRWPGLTAIPSAGDNPLVVPRIP